MATLNRESNLLVLSLIGFLREVENGERKGRQKTLVMDCGFTGVVGKQSSQRAVRGRGLRVGGEEEEVHLHSSQA